MVRMISLEASQLSPMESYKLLIGSVVPRPIAFISTMSLDGVGNLAPYSFFNAVSSLPPALMFAATYKLDRDRKPVKKDTLRNIEATGEFVVNVVSEHLAAQVNQTSAEYPFGVDEMPVVGLTPVASLKVKPFRVKESLIQMECKLHGTMQVGEPAVGASIVVVGEILAFHLDEKVYDAASGRVSLEALRPISRLGGLSYGRTSETFELPRAIYSAD
jgi:flavin reductase (DIM6/NTAB) family NADH-FMN oxidoreductase RutF